jgi:hypothetical protein
MIGYILVSNLFCHVLLNPAWAKNMVWLKYLQVSGCFQRLAVDRKLSLKPKNYNYLYF